MVQKRVVLTVIGDVQTVGYRNLVEKIAIEMNVEGIIKNLKDGAVKIEAEADESVLKTFISRIRIYRPEDIDHLIPRIEVQDIKEEWGGATGKYKGFKRTFDEESKTLEEETSERWDKGLLMLKVIARALSDFSRSTSVRFDILDKKYSTISIIASAILVSLTIIGIFASMIYSNIIGQTVLNFFYILTVYIILWTGVILLVIKSRKQEAFVRAQ